MKKGWKTQVVCKTCLSQRGKICWSAEQLLVNQLTGSFFDSQYPLVSGNFVFQKMCKKEKLGAKSAFQNCVNLHRPEFHWALSAYNPACSRRSVDHCPRGSEKIQVFYNLVLKTQVGAKLSSAIFQILPAPLLHVRF